MRHIALILFLPLLFQFSCSKQQGNQPPVIESIHLDPEFDLVPGLDIVISAEVYDSEGDPLEFLWESAGGIMAEPESAITTWELFTSAEPLSYEQLTLTVSDGTSAVSRTKTIQVSSGLVVSGNVYFDGTRIPVQDAVVTIGKYSVTTDEKGHYSIGNLREGIYQVQAEREGFDPFETSLYVDHPMSAYHIPMVSRELTGTVEGNVRTFDGISFRDLKVALLNPDQQESDLHCFTLDDGSFRLTGIPLGHRQLLVRSESPENHFLNDTLVKGFELTNGQLVRDIRIKIRRTVLQESYLAERDRWEFDGDVSDGFYLIGKGQELVLKEFVDIPEDAEKLKIFLDSYVVGGCNMVGIVPSHRLWISNPEGKYIGGISWGGEGSNYPAILSWYPEELPTFLKVHGNSVRLSLEVHGENTCLPNPYWRVYRIELSYYH